MNALTPEQEKIDALNRKAWETRFSNPIRSGLLSDEAIDLAKTINYRKGIAEGLRTYAFTLIPHTSHDGAMEFLDQAMDIFQEIKDECGQSDIYEYYGIISRNKVDFKSSLEHLYTAYQLRKDNDYTEGEAMALYQLGSTYRFLGNLEKSLDFFLQSLEIGQKYNFRAAESFSVNEIGSIYLELHKPDEALPYLHKSLHFKESQGDQRGILGCLDNIGRSYFMLKQFDKAGEYFIKGFDLSTSIADKKGEGDALLHLAEIEIALSNPGLAYEYATRCLSVRNNIGDKNGQAETLMLLIKLNPDKNTLPSLKNALELATVTGSINLLIQLHYQYYEYYKKNHVLVKALDHLELYNKALKDLNSQLLMQKIAHLEMAQQVELQQKESEVYRLREIKLAAALHENEKQKNIIASATGELKSAREQIVQREKLASLGGLTAGIIHEIQNPMNFVINYAESGSELVEKLNIEIRKGNLAELLIIAAELKNNFNNIHFHGQRANGIVQTMIQHSQPGAGKKQLTVINNLVDEYLRLAYQSMRLKDKTFNTMLHTDFDKNAGKINIDPREIGLALLNLFNHAFNAVTDRLKQSGLNYEPAVLVSTKREMNNVFIIIADNGTRLTKNQTVKNAQPVFSPDLTSEETGLGLSMSFDIIKSAGGRLKAEGMENEFSRFIIELPV